MIKPQNTILYAETKQLPETFSNEDIDLILFTIQNSKNYPSHDWGLFLRKRDHCIVNLLFELALRPKEGLSLRFDDFNLKEMTVFINGKNNKTGKDRYLPLTERLAKHLKEYLCLPRARFWGNSPYIFPSFQNRYQPLSPGRWKAIFRDILKESNLYLPCQNSTIPRLRSYTLRHTRLSQIFNQTKDIYLVSNIAGHSSIASSKVYIHKDKDYMDFIRKQMQVESFK